jgi:tetratricopeptide (TPR) repeat protein
LDYEGHLVIQRLRIAHLERKGFNALSGGDYRSAVEAFAEILRREPSRTGTRHNLGLAYLGSEEFEKAEACFLKDLELLGDYYPRIKVLGDLYYIWGKREEANRWYRKALREKESKQSEKLLKERVRQTESPEAFQSVRQADEAYRRGVEALKGESYQAALEEFRLAAQLNPTHVLAWNNAGTVLMNRFDSPEEARKAFEEGIEMEPLPILQMNLQKAAEAVSIKERKSKRKKRE